MSRFVLYAIGIVAIAGFLVFLFWPSGERREPHGQPPQGTAVYEGVDWETYAGNARAGETLAQDLCVRCHAVGSSGESPVPDATPFRTFKSRWPLEHLEEALAEGIMVGHPEHQMPVFQFDVEQIADLTAYLEEVAE